MDYRKPELRVLGTLAGLTMGMNGSCLDGTGLINQHGGGLQEGCGPSG